MFLFALSNKTIKVSLNLEFDMQESRIRLGGKLIVIAGGNGAGKKTQCDLLVARLKREGFVGAYADFPQHDKLSSYFVRKYLNKEYGHPNKVGPYRASIFFALDRYDDSERLHKELERGSIIVSNRYVSANIGHQGGKIKDETERNKFLNWLLNFEFNLMGIPKPDLVIYLHVPPEIADKLIEKKEVSTRRYIKTGNKDAHEIDPEHNKNAEKAFIYASKKYGWPMIKCIANDVLRLREAIHEEIWSLVRPLIYKE